MVKSCLTHEPVTQALYAPIYFAVYNVDLLPEMVKTVFGHRILTIVLIKSFFRRSHSIKV